MSSPAEKQPGRSGKPDSDRLFQIIQILRRTRESTGAFIHDFDPRSIFDVSPEERVAHFEAIWAQRGFAKWLSNFRDVMTNPEANAPKAVEPVWGKGPRSRFPLPPGPPL